VDIVSIDGIRRTGRIYLVLSHVQTAWELAPDDPLLVRADYARRLIAADPNVDPLEMLAAVVWPESGRLENAKRRTTADDLERMHELRSYGYSHLEIAKELGWTRPTVTDALRRDRLRSAQLAIW
jgi:hypothetical protein